MANKTQEIDFSKLKSSYSLKGKTTVVISGIDGFAGSIDYAYASGSNLTLVMDDERKLKLKNISNPKSIVLITDDLALMDFQKFYDTLGIDWVPEKGTKVTGSVFDDYIDVSDFEPTEKNEEKGIGLTINAGKGDDIIIDTDYNDKITGGAGKDTFMFSSDTGKNTINDPTKDDTISITGASVEDLVFKKTGNNLEIFYDMDFDEDGNPEFENDNKIVVKNYFKTKASKRIEDLITDNNVENIYKLSEQTFVITGKKSIKGTAFNDEIYGSTSSDTIKAGDGDDTIIAREGKDKIYAGKGKNTIVFAEGYGNDIVYSNGGEDTLQFDDINEDDISVVTDGKNLKLVYSEEDSVTINNYYKNTINSVQYIIIGKKESQSLTEFLKTKITVVNTKSVYTGKSMDAVIGEVQSWLTSEHNNDGCIASANVGFKNCADSDMLVAFVEGNNYTALNV